MTTGGDDRLSGLSDDLLRRILYFLPSKDAASTSRLSRRWDSLWRSCGAVNLAVQVQKRQYGYGGSCSYEEAHDAIFSCQEAFVRGAKAALDAAEVPISRLTLLVESMDGDSITLNQFLCRSRDWSTGTDVVGALVSHQAARHVEELRIAAVTVSDFLNVDQENHLMSGIRGEYDLASLPSSDTLRVLDLTRCKLTVAFPLALPRLATLQLRLCSVEPKVLQALLDGAPELTTVQLESLLFSWPATPKTQPNQLEPPALRMSLQAVTTLVLSSCGMRVQGSEGRLGSSWPIEINAPRLQSFKYKGLMRGFVLRPAGAGLARVDLHFLQSKGHDYYNIRTLFWDFVHNFTNARTVKLKVDNDLKDIAAFDEASHARLLACVFPSVERLELEGACSSVDYLQPKWMQCRDREEEAFPSVELEGIYCPVRESAAVAIANLLDCCPVLGEFMLKLSAALVPDKDSQYCHEFLHRKDRSDYSRSINRFVRRRKSKTTISTEDNIFGDKYSYHDVPAIPGLNGRSFASLQRTLKRVGLQFQLDNNSISECLGLRLIKFFANHARVLEEMYVDTGNQRLVKHLNFNVETQMALAPIPVSATTSSATLDSTIDLAKRAAGFTVLPLRRQERM